MQMFCISRAYEAPEIEEIDLLMEEDFLDASLNGGNPPVPNAGDGGSMDDDFWG
jgi:hypothetical protein